MCIFRLILFYQVRSDCEVIPLGPLALPPPPSPLTEDGPSQCFTNAPSRDELVQRNGSNDVQGIIPSVLGAMLMLHIFSSNRSTLLGRSFEKSTPANIRVPAPNRCSLRPRDSKRIVFLPREPASSGMSVTRPGRNAYFCVLT